MAVLLYRLGHCAYRHRKAVLAAWLAVLAALIACVAVFGSKLDDRFAVPGTESQRALDSLSSTLPAASGAEADLVFTAPPGHSITEAPYVRVIARTLDQIRIVPQVSAVAGPQETGMVSADRTTAVAQVQFPVQRAQVNASSLQAVESAAHQAEQGGLTTYVGGSVYGSNGVEIGPSEVIGVVVALLVLVVTFGSLMAAGMSLLPALIGVGVGLAGLLALTPLVDVSSTALTLALMLGLAVGIDYSLFILSRHRAQLARGEDPLTSMALANGTAGSAVLFAGTTVIIALAALTVIGIPFLTVMGLGAAGAVAVAVLAATTLLPAVAGFAGSRLAPKPRRRTHRRIRHADEAVAAGTTTARAASRRTLGGRWIALVIAKPLLTVLATVGLLLTIAAPALDLRLSLPDNGSAPTSSSERRAYEAVAAAFGPGFNGPLLVVTDTHGADPRTASAKVARQLATMPGVKLVSPPQSTSDPARQVIQVVPGTGPDNDSTTRLVGAIRAAGPEILAATGTSVAVTGTTAVNIDVSQRLGDSLLPFVAIVVGLSLLLLMVVFRSVVIPLKATLGFLLSVGSSLGAVVALFSWGWFADLLDVPHTGPVVSFLPIILIGVLFGLAMDYEVFLVAGIREEWTRTGDARRSVTDGSQHSIRVVTAAALIMLTIFGSFFTLDDAIIKPIAFALAIGVAIDAFAVRMTLVPAVLALVGRRAWWLPGWLDRILPDLDVEGTALIVDADPTVSGPQPDSDPAYRGGAAGTVSRLRDTFSAGRTRPVPWRRAQLTALRGLLTEHEQVFTRALQADLGKSATEAHTTEIGFILNEIDHTLRHLDRWLRPRRVPVPLSLAPARARTVQEPLGTVLIISPWNYPLQLALAPLAGALAAGNCAVVKPSELAPATSAALAHWLPRALDPRAVAVVEGGAAETTALLQQPFDHIFYTGNGTVGRIVMAAAASQLTPVTLELGGKSPVVVEPGVDLATAARRIAWGKFMNAGQTCVAPDYVLAIGEAATGIEPHLAAAIREMYGNDPAASSDYGRIVNDRHFDRLTRLLADGRTVVGGDHHRPTGYIAPTVLADVDPDSAVMREEIFGPILPVVHVPDLDAAISFITGRNKPLALYAFTASRGSRQRLTAETSSGALAFGAPNAHLTVPGLPFGGVGESGLGRYHGSYSLGTFSHTKAVLHKPLRPDTLRVAYPPFSRLKQRLLRRLA